MQIERILATSPNRTATDSSSLAECIAACLECEQTCTACADACLGEEQVGELRRCIRLNLDCADICGVSARILSRMLEADAGVLGAQLEACACACAACGAECHHHASHHEHCAVCAEACRRCADQCRKVARASSAASA